VTWGLLAGTIITVLWVKKNLLPAGEERVEPEYNIALLA
jgi:hypothetical protein